MLKNIEKIHIFVMKQPFKILCAGGISLYKIWR